MNPQNLFTLTARQKNDYLKQPDMVTGNGREKIREEYEIPPFIPIFPCASGIIRRLHPTLPTGITPRRSSFRWKEIISQPCRAILTISIPEIFC